MSEENFTKDNTFHGRAIGLSEASIFRDWRLSNLKETAEGFDDFLFITDYFLQDWRNRISQRPAPWDAELLKNLLPDDEPSFLDHTFDDRNFFYLYLWEHMEVWRNNIAGVEKEFINEVLLPAHRTSQIFLIDFLVHAAWNSLTPAQSWKFFKMLIASDDWDFMLASRASLVFSEIEDYPVGWWPPLLEELVPGREWRKAWGTLPSQQKKKTLREFSTSAKRELKELYSSLTA